MAGNIQLGLPLGFTAIKDAVPGTITSFIGILTDIAGPYRARASPDWELEFTIYDGLTASSFQRSSSIRCKFSRPERNKLPVGTVNDPVLVRSVNVIRSNGSLEAHASKEALTEVYMFPTNKIPIPEYSAPYGQGGGSTLSFSGWARPPTPSEQLAIINIKALAATSSALRAPTMQSSRFVPPYHHGQTAIQRHKKDSLLKDVEASKFCNLTVEVVKIYDGNDTLDLFVTDYTTNKNLFLYEDPKQTDAYSWAASSTWKGPYGQVTIAIRLWDPHASYAREEIQVGDVVFLTNVHIKWSQAGPIEGALHQDKKFPNKLQVRKISNRDQIAAHHARKEAYLGVQNRQSANQPHQPKKASAKKSAKKKEEKKARERQEKEAEQRQLEKKLEEEAVAKANLNQHIRASHKDIQLSTCEEILNNPTRKAKNEDGVDFDLPFVNAKYRARVRVVDFSPPRLEDFCHSMSDTEWNPSANLPYQRRDDRWEWGFVLLVEDANPPAGEQALRFPLFVCNDSAQHLLKMDAFDPSKDARGKNIKKLEEKLFILWGNLLELKKDFTPKGVRFPLLPGSKTLQNKPFECCIEEYGARVPPSPRWPAGWQRMQKLASTLIVD